MALLELITAITFILEGNSFHFNRDDNMNEDNNIRGIELILEDSEYRPFIKIFNNSFEDDSNTIGINYQKCTDGKFKICGGYSAGVVDGYKNTSMNPSPYIAPYVSIHAGDIELGAGCLQTACIYEFKLKYEF